MAEKFISVVKGVRFDGKPETYSCDRPSTVLGIKEHSHQTAEAAAVCGQRQVRKLSASAAHRRGAGTRFAELGTFVCVEDLPGGAMVRYAVQHGLTTV